MPTLALGLMACASTPSSKPIARPIASTGTEVKVAKRAPEARKIDGLTVPPVKVKIRPLQGRVLPERAADTQRWRAGPVPVIPLDHLAPDRSQGEATIDDSMASAARVLGSLRAAKTRGKKTAPPQAMHQAWSTLLEAVDVYLDQPPARTPAVQLVRTKVAIETELDADDRAWLVSSDLATRVRSRLAYLEHRIERARAKVQPMRQGRDVERLVWPVDPVIVNSEFGLRVHPMSGLSRMHYGIDLDGYDGQVIVSSGAGVVVWAGWMGGHGKHIEVMHPGGWVTRYSHLAHIMVREGERLEAGDSIGFVGSTGRSTGPHLHFEIWRDGEALDPAVTLGAPPFTIDVPGSGWGG
ncbi:MAG: peptidoglycan DD-metalloendopeptidase family protein [Deltaproteobacteria bacterium]|nr:peptidoglycan DD-metalloendopeptidase family protein [Deltaproteobacteria bacterium]